MGFENWAAAANDLRERRAGAAVWRGQAVMDRKRDMERSEGGDDHGEGDVATP